jgi:hypothetical protein
MISNANITASQIVAYRNLSGDSRSVDSETVESWKNY